MYRKDATTTHPIHELLARRWSPRAFDPLRPVTRAQLGALLEAARWAPSCNGAEPWRYLVWDRARDAAGWQAAFECLAESNRRWVKDVPVLLLACAGATFPHNGKPNRYAQHDTGMASLALALQAVALGLAAHQMGGFDAVRARAVFAIPEAYTPMAMIAVGCQAAPETLDEDIRAKETAPRTRRPLAETFYEGGWGRPVELGS